MPKPGKQKASCDRYKSQGRLEANREKKAERNKRRIAKFAARREAGKAYEYEPIPDEIKSDRKKYNEELRNRSEKNVDRRLPLQKEISRIAKLEYELQKKEKEAKLLGDQGNRSTHYKKKAHNAEAEANRAEATANELA